MGWWQGDGGLVWAVSPSAVVSHLAGDGGHALAVTHSAVVRHQAHFLQHWCQKYSSWSCSIDTLPSPVLEVKDVDEAAKDVETSETDFSCQISDFESYWENSLKIQMA